LCYRFAYGEITAAGQRLQPTADALEPDAVHGAESRGPTSGRRCCCTTRPARFTCFGRSFVSRWRSVGRTGWSRRSGQSSGPLRPESRLRLTQLRQSQRRRSGPSRAGSQPGRIRLHQRPRIRCCRPHYSCQVNKLLLNQLIVPRPLF
jgi:hypothetical protein